MLEQIATLAIPLISATGIVILVTSLIIKEYRK